MSEIAAIQAAAERLADPDVEAALIGAVLIQPDMLGDLSGVCRAEDFATPAFGRLWHAMLAMHRAGMSADTRTLRRQVEGDPELVAWGGMQYLMSLASEALNIVDADQYARLVATAARGRRILADVADMAREIADPEYLATTSLHDAVDRVQSAVLSLDRHTGGMEWTDLATAAEEAIADGERMRAQGREFAGLTTGFRDLDRCLGGLEPDCLYILGARPGMGKSALALDIAAAAAGQGVQVDVYSLEMGARQLGRRQIAKGSGVSPGRLKTGSWDHLDAEAVHAAAQRLRGLPVAINAKPGLTPDQLLGEARRRQRLAGTGLVIVDHMHLMRADHRATSRNDELREISGALKGIAKTLQTPVLALAQLNRSVESRDDKRPTIADLREGGSIEQDADAIMFLYREAYYLERGAPERSKYRTDEEWYAATADHKEALARCRHRADVICAKVRDDEPDTVTLGWDGPRTRFNDLSEER